MWNFRKDVSRILVVIVGIIIGIAAVLFTPAPTPILGFFIAIWFSIVGLVLFSGEEENIEGE